VQDPVILALDPGGTTGYAVLRHTPLATLREEPTVVQAGTFPDWKGLRALLDTWSPEVLVMEGFRLYPWKAQGQAFSEMIAPQVIGVAHYLAEERAIPVVVQSAAAGKAARLGAETRKAIGSRHAQDAVSHGAAYLRTLGRKQRKERT
jgi:hypothetical protein